MEDYIVRATAAGHSIRAFAITSKNLVEEARQRHQTSRVMTAALGRLLSAGAMMGIMMKGDEDLLTLQIRGDGPAKGLTVTADAKGNVKGYPIVADVRILDNAKGKLDVGGALGQGYLTVIKDLGLKEPYTGQTELQTGEIAEDLTYYFAVSEQVPSAVGLGVLRNQDNTVRHAGGFIIQLMPFAEDAVIDALEANLSGMDSVTNLMEQGHTPETMLQEILKGMDPEVSERIPTQFECNCCTKRVEKVLISLPKSDIQEMIDDGEPIEVKCHFCNTDYTFDVDELKEIIKA